MIIGLVGKSNSGKSTLAADLEKNCGFKRIISYTTRPPREGEENGKDYHFVDELTFMQYASAKLFAEKAWYLVGKDTWWYGTMIDDYIPEENENIVVILNPVGIKHIQKLIHNIKTVYLDIPDNVLIQRAIKRGDKKPYILARQEQDKKDFLEFETFGQYDYRVQYDITGDELIDMIKEDLIYE